MTFGVAAAVIGIAGEMRRLPTYSDNHRNGKYLNEWQHLTREHSDPLGILSS